MTTKTFTPAEGATVTVSDTKRTRYGPKAVLGGDTYDAKEAIKELDWEETHRTWDEEFEAWMLDIDSVEALQEVLEKNGHSLGGVASEIASYLHENVSVDMADYWRDHEIEITVTYESSRSENTHQKSGAVTAVDSEGGRVVFVREDGKSMRISGDSLYSQNPRYPYVGSIEEVTVEVEGTEVNEASVARA